MKLANRQADRLTSLFLIRSYGAQALFDSACRIVDLGVYITPLFLISGIKKEGVTPVTALIDGYPIRHAESGI